MTLQETRFPDKSTLRELVAMFRGFYRDGLSPDDVLARVSLEAKANTYVEQTLGRPAATPGGGGRPGRRSRTALPRRADDRASTPSRAGNSGT